MPSIYSTLIGEIIRANGLSGKARQAFTSLGEALDRDMASLGSKQSVVVGSGSGVDNVVNSVNKTGVSTVQSKSMVGKSAVSKISSFGEVRYWQGGDCWIDYRNSGFLFVVEGRVVCLISRDGDLLCCGDDLSGYVGANNARYGGVPENAVIRYGKYNYGGCIELCCGDVILDICGNGSVYLWGGDSVLGCGYDMPTNTKYSDGIVNVDDDVVWFISGGDVVAVLGEYGDDIGLFLAGDIVSGLPAGHVMSGIV